MLQRKRDDRVATARDVSEALERLGEGVPPPTRISDVNQIGRARGHGGGEPGRQEATGRGRRRSLAVGVGGIVGIVLLGTVGYLALRDETGSIVTDEAQSGTPLEQDRSDVIADPDGDSGAEIPTDTTVDERVATDDTTGDSVRDGVRDPVIGELTPATAEDLLFRQLDALVMGVGPTRLTAAEDSARIVWDQGRLGSAARALAAYLVGSVRAELGDTLEAVRWLRRAVELAPDAEGYRSLLEQLGGAS
jgi:hypothetical protein